jgi:hypothetical protein
MYILQIIILCMAVIYFIQHGGYWMAVAAAMAAACVVLAGPYRR